MDRLIEMLRSACDRFQIWTVDGPKQAETVTVALTRDQLGLIINGLELTDKAMDAVEFVQMMRRKGVF